MEILKLQQGIFAEATGYKFSIDHGDNVQEYRTNKSYQGLWIWAGQKWEQTRGTGQFSLSANMATAKRQIKAKFEGQS